MWEYKLKNEALVKLKIFPKNIADNVSHWVLKTFNTPVWFIPF